MVQLWEPVNSSAGFCDQPCQAMLLLILLQVGASTALQSNEVLLKPTDQSFSRPIQELCDGT